VLVVLSANFGLAVVLASHPFGCRVFQRCIEHLPDVQTQPLLDELLPNQRYSYVSNTGTGTTTGTTLSRQREVHRVSEEDEKSSSGTYDLFIKSYILVLSPSIGSIALHNAETLTMGQAVK
jgi:hypothetical protein